MRVVLVSALILAAALVRPAVAQDGDISGRQAYEKGDYATALAEWRRAAKAGDAKAQVNLGHMHALGHGVAKDESAALAWFRKAAEQGSPVAHHNIGVMYETGTRADPEAAARHYRIAAESGWTAAQTALAKLYQDGRGVARDYREAARWLERAADDNDAEAQFLLGVFYANGWGVERDLGEMLDWTRRAARQGHPKALFHLGFAYDRGLGIVPSAEFAARFYAVAAKKGEIRAKTRLGEMYFQGLGVERNLGAAIGLLTEAAAAGEAPALFLLGHAFHTGEGVARNPERGVAYWRRAARQGHAGAEFGLAGAYEEGSGVGRDASEAIRRYHLAADRGHAGASHALGQAYRAGRGVTRDDAAAVRWFLNAARAGHREAQLALARMYRAGIGVARNRQAALRWIEEAIRLGNPAAVAELAELYLVGDGVARDPRRALDLLREAANKGLKSAQTRIADLLAEGRLVPADPAGAAEWYRRLAEAGDAHGTAMLAAFHLDGRGGLAADPKRAAELFRIAARLGSAYAAGMLAALHMEGRGVAKDPAKAADLYRQAAAKGDYAANQALGGLYRQGLGVGRDLDAAARHYAAALAIKEKSDGPAASSLVGPLRRLAEIDHHRGRNDRAAARYRRAVEILGKGDDKAAYLDTLTALVAVYRDQRRPEAAAEAVSLGLRWLGSGNEESAFVLQLELARLYAEIGLDDRAAATVSEVLAGMEKIGFDGPGYRYALAERGRVLAALGRDEAAEADLVRALVLMERDRPDGFALQHAGALNDYGRLLVRLGHQGEAAAAFEKAEKLIDGLGLTRHPRGLAAARDFATAYEKEGKIDSAVAVMRRAIPVGVVAPEVGKGSEPREPDLLRQYLRLLTTPPVSPRRRAEAFDVVQRLAFSRRSPLSRRLAARMIASNDGLARLLDARREGLAARERITRRLVGPEAGFGRVDPAATQRAIDELRRLDAKLDGLAEALPRRFPRAAALLSPPPVDLDAVRGLLGDDEALVVTLSAREGTHVWVATTMSSHYYRVALAQPKVSRMVERLRASLEPPRDAASGDVTPYPLDVAAELYRPLFGPAEAILDGVSHVIHAPGGALRDLPLSVLVADLAAVSGTGNVDRAEAPIEPETARFAPYRRVVWFVDKFAYSRIPSPGALRALRADGAARRAPEAFVGIGGPIPAEPSKLAGLDGIPESLSPLHVMARRLGAPDAALLPGDGARYRSIKALRLNRFRTIAIAASGAAAGELPGVAEASLVLDAAASAAGKDGFLTASEIANLDLDADLVVLGADAPQGKARSAWLAALTEAFLQAGARSVMAARWPVERDAAAAFAAGMFARRDDDGGVRLARLAQRAALEVLSDETRPARFAHPRYWGAFALVGDGGGTL